MYAANAANGGKKWEEYLESRKGRARTTGGFFDVSSSEVDISDFSMDELAEQVENLKEELREF